MLRREGIFHRHIKPLDIIMNAVVIGVRSN